jgi:tetratricopeptide (TPR) repeat protein
MVVRAPRSDRIRTHEQVNSNEHNQAGLEFVDIAFAIGNSLDGHERDEILPAVAVSYAKLSLLDDAIKAAEEISDSYSRDTTITQIAVSAIGCDPDADVLSIIESIEDPGVHNLALEQLSVAYAEHGLFDEALDFSGRLENRDSSLASIITIIATENSLARAEELVSDINDSRLRATSLIDLAMIARDATRGAQAAELLLKAEAEVKIEETVEERVYHLSAIADVYETLSLKDKAKETLLQAFSLCNEIEGSRGLGLARSFNEDEALIHVAARFARYGHYDQADRVIEQIEDPFEFARASTQQAIELHQNEHGTRALELLSEASDLIISQECFGSYTLQLRDSSLAELAIAYATIGHYEEALHRTPLISNLEERFATWTELGRKAALAGLTDSIFKIYDELEADLARVSYLTAVSETLRKNGNSEVAVKLLLKAISDAEKMQRTSDKCLMLISISSRLLENDLEAKANEIVSNVLKTTAEIEDTYQQARILLALTEQYHQHPRGLSGQDKQMLERISI